MASRSSSGKSTAALDPALPQKKRARRRLVGAAVVCLAAAIVLPLVLDSEPRQIRGDVEVRIPSRDTPLAERSDVPARSGTIRAPGDGDAAGTVAGGGQQAAEKAGDTRAAPGRAGDAGTTAASVADGQPARPEAKSTESEARAQAAGTAAGEKPAADAQARSGSKVAPGADPIARLAEAKDAAASPRGTGFVVQIGAFSTDKGASEQVERARKAGFGAYKESVKTAQGERIRVRIGPFAQREAADQARAKLRAAGIESVLVAP